MSTGSHSSDDVSGTIVIEMKHVNLLPGRGHLLACHVLPRVCHTRGSENARVRALSAIDAVMLRYLMVCPNVGLSKHVT